jgi:hypothetical protein
MSEINEQELPSDPIKVEDVEKGDLYTIYQAQVFKSINLKASDIRLDFSHFFDLFTEQIKEKQEEQSFSNYTITSDGLVQETWKTIQHIPSRILEIDDEFVILECLTDPEKKAFQNRKIERSSLAGAVPLNRHQLVMMKISKRPGETRVQFLNGNRIINQELFDENYFSNLSKTKLTKRL